MRVPEQPTEANVKELLLRLPVVIEYGKQLLKVYPDDHGFTTARRFLQQQRHLKARLSVWENTPGDKPDRALKSGDVIRSGRSYYIMVRAW